MVEITKEDNKKKLLLMSKDLVPFGMEVENSAYVKILKQLKNTRKGSEKFLIIPDKLIIPMEQIYFIQVLSDSEAINIFKEENKGKNINNILSLVDPEKDIEH